jgi:adenosine deaminase
LAVRHYNFNLNDIGNIIINGFKSTFVNYKDKKNMLTKVLKELRAFGYDAEYLNSSTEVS